MGSWLVRQVVHFEPGDFIRDGVAHFGFHLRNGWYVAIAHQRHVLGVSDADGTLRWMAGPEPTAAGVPHIPVALNYPMFADELPDGSLIVSSFGTPVAVRLDLERRQASTFVDGRRLGFVDMGNCVVDLGGDVWINEVTGCRVWRFDSVGRLIECLGDGRPGDLAASCSFEEARFSWIYDLRRGPDGRIWVLDSRHFAVRAIDPMRRRVDVVAGTGLPGRSSDGGPALEATFGGEKGARFDGPISLALDDEGNAFIGDRWNHEIRMIDATTGRISTIAGRADADRSRPNDPAVRDPLNLYLPAISSLDCAAGRLYVPTDLDAGAGDLAILERGGD